MEEVAAKIAQHQATQEQAQALAQLARVLSVSVV
jgi:hypothetical protein